MSSLKKGLFALTVGIKIIKKKEWTFSFNVSDRCPINCDCYWRAQGRVKEMGDNEVVDFFLEMRRKGYQHVVLIGGEPYVRPQLLAKITGIIPATWLITSGTSPLGLFERTTHVISIDGKDPETHDGIRKSPGLFSRILKNLERARTAHVNSFPAFGHSVLNIKNFHQISDILSFWRNNGLLDGIVFSTATPISGAGDEHLRLSPENYFWIMEELLRLKDEFKSFLLMSDSMINHLNPNVMTKQTPAKCRTSQFVSSFAADGFKISQCVLSPKADCSACGCVISGMLDGIYEANFETIKMVDRLITI